jgi:predicted polyphosphate/ATP-dependent NAD kinase
MTDASDPNHLTSPGTVNDPELERERAAEAAAREAESRASTETKFEQELDAEEARRRELADRLRGELPPNDAA